MSTVKPKCAHGYGGFFRCPEGCHNTDPALRYEELDRNITYFQKRLVDLNVETGFEEPKRKL